MNMKVKPNLRGDTNDNPNEPPKAGASVRVDSASRSGSNDNPNEPPKAGASANVD
jgi:hypothetical protein